MACVLPFEVGRTRRACAAARCLNRLAALIEKKVWPIARATLTRRRGTQAGGAPSDPTLSKNRYGLTRDLTAGEF